jgi:hypothetical protein
VSTEKTLDFGDGLPENMATPMYSVQDLGLLMARELGLAPGRYEVVVQFKLGPIQMKEDQADSPVPAMGVGFGAFGLRPSTSDSNMSIEVPKPKRSKK